ncbi:MAG: hypothetical protein RLY31_531 [Bacteroidota bacterium]|jgi:demethylmenaquinone methyltransferase/2-methoxy-6-polyprenyl-1,4-benzoquinol methylase
MSLDHQRIKPYAGLDQPKKTQVSGMFNKIAPWYDFLNHLLSLGIDIKWRKDTIRRLRQRNPSVQRLLDVATGTADLAIEAARQLPDTQVTGIDISVEMLDIGRRKLRDKKLSDQITLLSGDSEQIGFPDQSFDAVTAAFGVRNFENLRIGLAEMHRVTKPGGTVAILEFSRPRVFPFSQLYQLYFRFLLPVIGKLTSRDDRAYRYLYESVQAFPDGERMLDILRETGFRNSSAHPFTLGICTLYLSEK